MLPASNDARCHCDCRLAIGDWRFQIGLPGWLALLASAALRLSRVDTGVPRGHWACFPLSNDRRFDQSQICNRRSAIANHSVAMVIRNLRLHPPSVLVLIQESLEPRVLTDRVPARVEPQRVDAQEPWACEELLDLIQRGIRVMCCCAVAAKLMMLNSLRNCMDKCVNFKILFWN